MTSERWAADERGWGADRLEMRCRKTLNQGVCWLAEGKPVWFWLEHKGKMGNKRAEADADEKSDS